MTFVVNAIKQEKEQTNSYLFLLDIDSQAIAREIIQSSGMILLSLTKYTQDKTEFGPMYVKILYNGNTYDIVSSTSFTLKDLCLFCVYAGLDVVDVNFFEDPQSSEQVNRIISFCKKTYADEKAKEIEEQIKMKQEAEKKKYFEDRLLKDSKIAVAWILDKIETLLKDKRIHIPSKDQKWIDTQLNEIKKQRMWSNYEKIKVLAQDLFVFINSLEDTHYTSLVDNSQTIFKETAVSQYDLDKQTDILEEVKYQSSFGGTVLWFRREYLNLPILPYFLFLQKDFFSLFNDIWLLLYRLFDVILLVLILIFAFLAWILAFNKFFLLGLSTISIYYNLISLWRFALLLFTASWFRIKNKTPILAWLLLGVVAVYFITLPIIEHSFTLK